MSVLMLSLMGTFVLADEKNIPADAGLSTAEIATAIADENVESSSGILSDKFKMVFANKEKKAKIRMDIASKRMNEIKKAEKNPEKVKDAVKKYEAELDDALESFDEIAIDGDKEQVIHALKQTVIMKYRLETHGQKVSEVHARILVRQSEKMNAEQAAHLTDVFSNINVKVDSKISKIEELQENLIARAVVLGLNEEEVRAKLESFEASLDAKRELREEQFKSRIEVELGKDGERFREKLEIRNEEIKFESRDQDGRIRFKTEKADDVAIVLN